MLQTQLVETEQRVALARAYYNDIATQWATRLEQAIDEGRFVQIARKLDDAYWIAEPEDIVALNLRQLAAVGDAPLSIARKARGFKAPWNIIKTVQAAVEAGVPATDDFNGTRQEGAGFYQTTTSHGRRASSAVSWSSVATSDTRKRPPARSAQAMP
mgnify:CR=1 FL=1